MSGIDLWRSPSGVVRTAYCLLLVLSLCPAETGSGTSPKGPLDIRPREAAPPSLTFDANFHDASGDGICQGGEEIALVVAARNKGQGSAQGVRVVLSGTSGLVDRLGRELIIGTLEPEAAVTETLKAVLPPGVTAETDKTLVVKVKEAREEWSSPDEKSFTIAMQPQKGSKERKVTYVDVDLVPESRHEDPNAVAAVIGVSTYREDGVPVVTNAERDAKMVERYLRNVCGVKACNIFPLYGPQAGSGDLRELFEVRLPRAVKPGSSVYVYFAGHGTPVGKEGRPMLVPWDATAASETKLYPVADIVRAADNWAAKRTLVMLDACFAGGDRVVYKEGERPAVRPNIEELVGTKTAVLTASSADEAAQDLPAVKHGLFTYFLLKALKGEADDDADGWVTMKELTEYVRVNVSEEAADKLDKPQNPSLLPEGFEKTAEGWRVGKSK
jgi:hypothetical protein